MDPALWELLRAEAGADGDRVLEAIIRFARPGIEIPGVRIVSRFGPIATCRIRARDVIAVRARPDVVSVKAPRLLSPGFEPALPPLDPVGPALPSTCATDIRRSPALALTGAGVVVASVDWGVDVDSAAFRWPGDSSAAGGDHEAGATRFLSFWDQRDQALGPRPEPYGYGAVHDREEIDRALQSPRPYEYLGYHPAIADPKGTGTHGTHVLDIAAGNGQAGGPVGIAPGAHLIFVHLADRNTGGLANFGDSVRLLEAIDFISRIAGPLPCVINISAGRVCGPKDGTTLVERALDELLATTPGRFVVNSAGNYFRWRTHACGAIAPGEAHVLTFAVDPTDITVNELEIWYDGADEFTVRIDPPGYAGGRPIRLGERSDLLIEGRAIGRVYHRKHDPNNGDNHIVAFLDPVGCAGDWTVTLEARRVSNGRFHAWIERDDSCPRCQARFTHDDSNPATTIGTITTSHLPLVVGAYDGHDPAWPAAPFSSGGPSRDGRDKPDFAAPGVGVLAARSAPVGASRNPGLLVRKSGTSMATPHVTGAVALCFEAMGTRLSAQEIRSLVLDSCDPVTDSELQSRLGRGYLNIARLVADMQQALATPTTVPDAKEPTMDTEDAIVLLAAAPATVYREYLYRPRGRLARWIGDHYDVVAKPGQRIGHALQEGDVLLEVTLGHMSGGRCIALTAGDLEFVASRPMPPGHLLLRPRRQVETSKPLPVEPAADGVPGSDGGPGEEPDRGAESGEAARHGDGSGGDDSPPDPGPWMGPDPDNFRARVLAEDIAAIPRFASPATHDLGGSFQLATLPSEVQQAFKQAVRKGGASWCEAVREARIARILDPRRLADLMFFIQHPERMTAGVGKLIEEQEPGFYKLRAEWTLYLTIVTRILQPSTKPTVFLQEDRSSRNYEDFLAAQTTGRITLMVHGRNSDGSGHAYQRHPDKKTKELVGGFRDQLKTLDSMQETVESLSNGDSLYIANWQFDPTQLPLTAPPSRSTNKTWADLLADKAKAGVKIRVIIAQHPPETVPVFMIDPKALRDIIHTWQPEAIQDNLKYLVSQHPHLHAVHHQKFMVARTSKHTVAFCGGLDISRNRAPQGLPPDNDPRWNLSWVWHDVGAKLEGLIAYDLERQFVELWNRDRDKSTEHKPPPGWKPLEKLAQGRVSTADKANDLNQHPLQMLRTVTGEPKPSRTFNPRKSNPLDTPPSNIKRDDVWRGYFRLIGRATSFIYLENQYFYQPELADAIVKQAESQPQLIVIIMAGTGSDDPRDNQARQDYLDNQMALRLEFFNRLSKPPLSPNRLRVYTLNYSGGILHAKLILVDDEALMVGSANANPRGFFFDTEVNVMLDHAPTVKDFRQRLWAHDLGVDPDKVADVSQFFNQWDTVAKSNQAVQATPEKMVGEGVIPFNPVDPKDPRFRAGKRGPIHIETPIPGKTLDVNPPEEYF